MSNLKHNAAEWNSLSAKDQKKITDILRESNLLGANENVVPDVSTITNEMATPGIGRTICKIGCGVAEAAAVAACAALPPPANGICIIAAHAAGDLCRDKC